MRPLADMGISPRTVRYLRQLRYQAVGMREAMATERSEAYRPEDVLAPNMGFDIRSIRLGRDGSMDDVRNVEVKARARSVAIRLTCNEWKHARKLGERFWLHIVTEAATVAPQLHRIPDPAAKFAMGEDIVATGYVLDEAPWRKRARE